MVTTTLRSRSRGTPYRRPSEPRDTQGTDANTARSRKFGHCWSQRQCSALAQMCKLGSDSGGRNAGGVDWVKSAGCRAFLPLAIQQKYVGIMRNPRGVDARSSLDGLMPRPTWRSAIGLCLQCQIRVNPSRCTCYTSISNGLGQLATNVFECKNRLTVQTLMRVESIIVICFTCFNIRTLENSCRSLTFGPNVHVQWFSSA